MPDDKGRNTTILRDYCDTTTIYAINAKLAILEIHAVFQHFRCLHFDTILKTTMKLELTFSRFSERVENSYPSNLYQIQEGLFDKLDSSGIKDWNQNSFLLKWQNTTSRQLVKKKMQSKT